jgi:hypothetical protein
MDGILIVLFYTYGGMYFNLNFFSDSMPPIRSRIEPMTTRTKSKRQKQTSAETTVTVTHTNNIHAISQEVHSIVYLNTGYMFRFLGVI